MKHKVIRIIGVLLVVVGAAVIIHNLTTTEKSVIGSIAGGVMPIIMGALVLGVSLGASRRKASGKSSDTPKG